MGGLIIVSVSQDNPNYVSQEQLGRVSVCSEDETAGEGDGKPSENHKTAFCNKKIRGHEIKFQPKIVQVYIKKFHEK